MRVSQRQHCVGKDEYELEPPTNFIESGGRSLQPDNIHCICWLIQAHGLLAMISNTVLTQANPGYPNVHPYTSISTQHARNTILRKLCSLPLALMCVGNNSPI
jgi:hypothetical protein